MKQKMFEKFFKEFCPNYEIVYYNLNERFKYDDNGGFVKMSSAIDITVRWVSHGDESLGKMIEYMERTLGIDIMYNLTSYE
jgi:hypothetical protein